MTCYCSSCGKRGSFLGDTCEECKKLKEKASKFIVEKYCKNC